MNPPLLELCSTLAEEEQELQGEEEMEEQGDTNYKVFKNQPGILENKLVCHTGGNCANKLNPARLTGWSCCCADNTGVE